MRWVNRMVQELGVGDAIDWLGPLDGREIVHELRGAAAALIPTFIENCCTAMQEAMAIGTPVVVSFVGGIPSLARDEESCLFFPPDDDALCAFQLERAITDGQLAGKLAVEARKIAALRNDRGRILARQLHIYDEVVGHRNPTL